MTIIEKIRSEKSALKVSQVATYLGCHTDKIYDLTNAKKNPIPHFRIGSMLRFDPVLVAEWFEQRQVTSNPPR